MHSLIARQRLSASSILSLASGAEPTRLSTLEPEGNVTSVEDQSRLFFIIADVSSLRVCNAKTVLEVPL